MLRLKGIFIFLVVLACSQSAFAVPLVWVHVADKKLPANVLDGGYDENKVPLYICRVPYKGGIHPGKLISNVMVCNIGWEGGEYSFSEYDVLVKTGEPFRGLWASDNHDFSKGFVGGTENGHPLYVCRVHYTTGFPMFTTEHGLQPGKVTDDHDHCQFPFGGKENLETDYELLEIGVSAGSGSCPAGTTACSCPSSLNVCCPGKGCDCASAACP
jgi:hypothetical protein